MKNLMDLFVSLRTQNKILAGFVIVLVFGAFASVAGIYFTLDVAGDARYVFDRKVPLQQLVLRTRNEIEQVNSLANELRSIKINPEPVIEKIEAGVQQVETTVTELEETIAAIENEEDRVRSMENEEDRVRSMEEVHVIHAEFEAYRKYLTSLIEVRRKTVSYNFSFEEAEYSVREFLGYIYIDLSGWANKLRDAVRFKSKFKGNLDEEEALVTRWSKVYAPSDPKIQGNMKQMQKYVWRLIKVAKEIEKAPKDKKAKKLKALEATDLKRFERLLVKMYDYTDLIAFQQEAAERAAYKGLHDSKDAINAGVEVLANDVTRAVEVSKKSASASVRNAIIMIGGILLGSMVAGIALAFLIGRAIANPLVTISRLMERLGKGDKAIEVVHKERGDEIGTIATALQTFKETAVKADELAVEQAREQEAKLARQERVEELIANFQANSAEVIETVNQASTQLNATSDTMKRTVTEANTKTGGVNKASAETAESVTAVATASEELDTSAKEIVRQVEESQGAMVKTSENATAAGKSADDLSTASESIGNVVELIQNIAAQINLLALNATIESARAGEAGKGFAVVAGEVKNLAHQAQSATEDIEKEIANIQETSKTVIDVIESIKQAVIGQSQLSEAINSTVCQQVEATAEITERMRFASDRTSQMRDDLRVVSESTEHASVTSNEVTQAAEVLADQCQRITNTIEEFLSDIRAA